MARDCRDDRVRSVFREADLMAGTGKRVKFHGAFRHKSDAVEKEEDTPGSYIREIVVKGQKRYLVLTRRGGK